VAAKERKVDMKRKYLAAFLTAVLLFAFGMLAGCGKAEGAKPEEKKPEEPVPEEKKTADETAEKETQETKENEGGVED
jgi:ABC-type oligopeptide transport system substrate-binding subunit